jgi:two-component system nitrogen regulation sensor histidine kinase GlnL
LPCDPRHLVALDLLTALVAVVDESGRCHFVNTTFEEVLAVPRRSMLQGSLLDVLVDPQPVREALQSLARNQYAASRLEAVVRRFGTGEPLAVFVTVSQLAGPGGWNGYALVEMVEIEQMTRLDREQRDLGLASANKELIRNLAHEIKNPLGGIRGAAQLLQMEGESKALTEYTQVIIREADRLQDLVDRLLAPHRRAQLVNDVNIHQVCEHVRSVIRAEYPRGLELARDYDISIPEFRGDGQQLIQAVLNITQNAAQALSEQIAQGTARILYRTRIVRNMTIGGERRKLALVLHIEDNGPGIPESIRERIFYPLVSGRANGSGLGLTLAQTFVQQHQGMIDCESEPGRTVFRLLIPLP